MTAYYSANDAYLNSPDFEFYDNFITYQECIYGKTYDTPELLEYTVDKYLNKKRKQEDRKPKKKIRKRKTKRENNKH